MTLGAIVARRRKCAMTTRGEMLCAARRRFLQESYENVGLRDIARDVGVDVALVSRYFGSKEDLFKEVLRGGDSPKFGIEVGAGDLPAFLASLFEANDDELSRTHFDNLLILLRSASSPAAARIVQEGIREDMLGPIAAVLRGDNRDARAGLSLAILLGATMLRGIMGVHPLCEGERRFVERKLAAVFEAALSDDDQAPSS